MVKKLFLYIFIYTLLVGCDTQSVLTNNECDCEFEYMNVQAPNLETDENGYYHIEWLEGYNQTFTTLTAETGSNIIQRVLWNTDVYMIWNDEEVYPINHYSYTDEDDGIAHTVLSAWEEQIGDTLTVYAWYRDDCDIEHTDSIKVVIDNEI